MKILLTFLVLAFATTGCSRRSVSLSLTSASAKQEKDYLHVRCVAALDNQTGSSLVVTSAFFSAFDSLRIIVSTTDGTRLAEQSYAMHQSPFSIPGRAFVLPSGITTQAMSIPVFGVTNAPSTVTLQLTGTLMQSGFTDALASSKRDVTVIPP